MKQLDVYSVQEKTEKAADIPSILDKAKIAFQPIDQVNWKEYPYKPDVKFRIAYTEEAFYLNFEVSEKTSKATYAKYNEAVWTDSCVEFFVTFDNNNYYNIECNCIGNFLMGFGASREGRNLAAEEVCKTIHTWSSLGSEPFEEKSLGHSWQVALCIPFSAFIYDQISLLKNQEIRANFYKCGDDLTTPHFLSWSPIDIKSPDFHRPDFFGKLTLKG